MKRFIPLLILALASAGCMSSEASTDANGWNTDREVDLFMSFTDMYPTLDDEVAHCIVDHYVASYTYSEVTDMDRYPTTSELADSTAAVESCL